jgi:hypothetical protein
MTLKVFFGFQFLPGKGTMVWRGGGKLIFKSIHLDECSW